MAIFIAAMVHKFVRESGRVFGESEGRTAMLLWEHVFASLISFPCGFLVRGAGVFTSTHQISRAGRAIRTMHIPTI